jgi:aldose 1-epimerase
MAVVKEGFGQNAFGDAVELFTFTNSSGMKVRIMNHGGTILSIEVPDRNGVFADVVLGHEFAAEYVDGGPYLGCVVGRYANRIKAGKFSLDGAEYTLAINNGPNALHGGLRGFDKRVFASKIIEAENAVEMTLVSADGEEGFPGEVTLTVTYSLSEQNELKIAYRAMTTTATPINLTNHSYFNLAGHNSGYVGEQVMMINADGFLPSDETAIPFGNVASVEGTPFDFRQPVAIGARINEDNEQLKFAAGYDHNYCLNKSTENELSFAARATDPASGRVMDVFTTQPGVQFYTGNYLAGTPTGKGGCTYGNRDGFCLETQHYPDSPNQPQFPSTILWPDTPFESLTVYQFSV